MSEQIHRFSRQASVDGQHVPAITVRFFYESLLTIDDPLSPVPTPDSSSSTKQHPHPFSVYDNDALDKAWNELRTKLQRFGDERVREKAAESLRETRDQMCTAAQESLIEHADEHSDSSSSGRRDSASRDSRNGSRRQSLARSSLGNVTEFSSQGARARLNRPRSPSRGWDSLQRDNFVEKDSAGAGLTARPFARLPSRKKVPTITMPGESKLLSVHSDVNSHGTATTGDCKTLIQKSALDTLPTFQVAVGVSRLHQVVMPELRMEPIYWSPVNDIAAVTRGTWFYKDTMLPVEVEVANMLEAGYLNLQPWTQTWQDELNSAVEVGAVGEEKIVQRLWPELPRAQPPSRPGSAMGMRATPVQDDPEKVRGDYVKDAQDFIDRTLLDSADHKAAGIIGLKGSGRKRYLESGIIYANDKEAYILRPNLQPSAYYGRRPLASYIRKGHNIGICVIRGFDQNMWDKIHPPARGKVVVAAQEGVSSAEAGQPIYRRMKSDPSLARSNRPRVTDLILVIHGIGQKLSERVESFHFTHAMNAFRRDVHVELGTPQVKNMLRTDMGGIMVLPVNWRATLAFEDGGYTDGSVAGLSTRFTLQDITPETLPSVRNIVSDVMLDIPYYLSHHQPKMIAAVIREANRIHRLWCRNNPGFETYGRVHLIAHSLGSVMALDILSKQPTSVQPVTADVDHDQEPKHFRFDTKNLYLAGSPAGFFLLLRSGTLLPRKNRNKPSSDGDDLTPGVAGEAGYGCMAVDNVYNVINPYDPVSYRLNATVDATYSAMLKQTIIPSAAMSWFARTNPFKAAAAVTQLKKPGLPPRLPSSVELETHNFTHEEVAEKRFMLLNDNGQIDFFLRYGGGPLDIQYLTMLGAHSSYWLLKDFVRFIVLETGRKLGREGALEPLKAAKKKAGAK